MGDGVQLLLSNNKYGYKIPSFMLTEGNSGKGVQE
jgi:hypothetical protein